MPSVHRPSCPPNEMGWPDTYRGELTQLLAHALPCQLSPCVCLPATAPIAKPAKDRRVVSWQPTSILHARRDAGSVCTVHVNRGGLRSPSSTSALVISACFKRSSVRASIAPII